MDREGRGRRWPVRALRGLAAAFLHDTVTTFFPADCRLCEAPLVSLGRAPVCEACLAQPMPQRGALCACCGEAMGMESERFSLGRGPEALLCTPCREVRPAFARAVAYGVYEGSLRELIHLFKYEGMTALAEPLGAMLSEAVGQLRAEMQATGAATWLVVPVPLAAAKVRSRGYNQAVLLAEATRARFARTGGAAAIELRADVLRRVRATESQFGLTPHQRRANLRGAFAVAEAGAVKGRRVLLIDDIYTTGATARVCSEVLRRAGAAEVLVATLARAQRESVALWDAGAVSAEAGRWAT